MAQPRMFHRVFFAFILATLSMALPEVITMNDPIPWIHPGGYILGYPVYGLHILVLGGLMLKYSRVRLVTLLAYGGIFGLYEGYLIKQLWNPNWGTEFTLEIGGVRVLHTLMLVFFVHPVLAFVLPLVIAELFLTRRGPIRRALPFLRTSRRVFVSLIVLSAWLGLLIGGNLAKHGGRAAIGAPLVSIGLVGLLAGTWRWGLRGNRFRIEDLMPHGKGLGILSALLVVEYLIYSRLVRPEAMPAAWMPHLTVMGLYAFFVALILLWRGPGAESVATGEDRANIPAAPGWWAVLGVGVFLFVAFVCAPAPQPGETVAVISFVGGAVLNVGFLVIALFLGLGRQFRGKVWP